MRSVHDIRYENGNVFKIVQFTDIHWSTGGEEDQRSRALMNEVLDAEKPDLVVFTGDTIYSHHCADPAASFREAVSAPETRGIPWVAVYGNHDTESGITREQLSKLQKSCKHSLAERDAEHCGDPGDFTLLLKTSDGEIDKALYFFDSGSYSDTRAGGYAAFRRSQIDWYVRQSVKLERWCGHKVPSLAFFHIPLPEYAEVWNAGNCCGHKHEDVCCPKLNTGMFAAMVERGDIMATFVGHDHINDFCGEWYGIHLCYGRATGYNTYGKEGFARGARVIALTEGEPGFVTWLRLAGGEVVHQNSGARSERKRLSG